MRIKSKKRVSVICGGMGNQLFQYAAVRSICVKSGDKIVLDIKSYERDIKRKFELNNYNIEYHNSTALALLLSIASRINNKLLISARWNGRELRENVYQNIDSCIYLRGYWQNIRYFENITEILQKDFTWKGCFNKNEEKDLSEIRNSNSIMVHVRRTDYLSNINCNDFCDLFNSSYYRNAIDYFKQYQNNPLFVIFSDDIEWCKEQLIFKELENVKFVERHDTDVDFELMRNCKNYIIANSTFSWWAAFLSYHEKKYIIGPKKWYVDSVRNQIIHNALDKPIISNGIII